MNVRTSLFQLYYERLKNFEFDERVDELARIRDEEGYMAESKKQRKGNADHILLEYNCPIIQVAEKHSGSSVLPKHSYLKNYLTQRSKQHIGLPREI